MKRIKRMVSALLVLTMCLSMSFGTLTAGAASVSSGSNSSSSSSSYVSSYSKQGGTATWSNATLSWASDDFVVGTTMAFTAKYSSSNGLKVSVSDSKIASIATKTSKDGKTVTGEITFKKPGTVSIKLINKKTGKTIGSQKFKSKAYIKSLKFSSSSKSCTKGKSYTLNYTVTKYNGNKDTSASFPSYVSVTASSSNSKVAKVTSTSKGKVKIKALKKGTATIKVKANDGSNKTASIKITVK